MVMIAIMDAFAHVDPLRWLVPLVWLLLANGVPVLATRVVGERGAWPLDGGLHAWDGRRLLGASKTWRGLLLGILVVTVAAVLLGFPPGTGATFALASLLGDAGSSFLKRRVGIEPSGRALGLDQIPEALLPLLVCHRPLGLGVIDVVAVVILFTVGQLFVSPIMFRMGVRRRPY